MTRMIIVIYNAHFYRGHCTRRPNNLAPTPRCHAWVNVRWCDDWLGFSFSPGNTFFLWHVSIWLFLFYFCYASHYAADIHWIHVFAKVKVQFIRIQLLKNKCYAVCHDFMTNHQGVCTQHSRGNRDWSSLTVFLFLFYFILFFPSWILIFMVPFLTISVEIGRNGDKLVQVAKKHHFRCTLIPGWLHSGGIFTPLFYLILFLAFLFFSLASWFLTRN